MHFTIFSVAGGGFQQTGFHLLSYFYVSPDAVFCEGAAHIIICKVKNKKRPNSKGGSRHYASRPPRASVDGAQKTKEGVIWLSRRFMTSSM